MEGSGGARESKAESHGARRWYINCERFATPRRGRLRLRLGCDMVVIAVGTYATTSVRLEAQILEVEVQVGGLGCEARG